MSNITGPEPVVNGVQEYIEDNIQTFIDEVNAGVTDGCTLARPIEVLPFVPSRSYMDNGLPLIGLQHGRLRPEDDTGWGFTACMPLTVVAFDMDPDLRRLAFKMMRWEATLMKLMLPPTRVITNEAWAVKFVSADPGPTLTRKENPRDFYGITTLTVELRFTQDV